MNLITLLISAIILFGTILYFILIEYNLIEFDSGADGGGALSLALMSPIILVPAGLTFIVQCLSWFTGEKYNFSIYIVAFFISIGIVTFMFFYDFTYAPFAYVEKLLSYSPYITFITSVLYLIVLPSVTLTLILFFIRKFFIV